MSAPQRRQLERIFTPWRYSYLTAPKGDGTCIFCRAAAESDRRSTLTLHVDDQVVVLLNRYPYVNGHVMVAPVGHIANLHETAEETLDALMRVTAKTQRILSDVYEPDGFNVGMNLGEAAGAGVADHYHVHVVPRWRGDSNFMSVTADVRLVPEELETTWDRLTPKFQSLS